MNGHEQTAWVVGASTGIGRAFAERLLKEGWRVAVTARRAAMLEEVKAGLPAEQQTRCRILPADLTDPDSILPAYEQLKQDWGVPDLLAANAGTHIHMTAANLNADDCLKILDLNLNSTVRLIVTVARDMVPRRSGTLMGVSSLAAYRGLPHAAAYGASKAGLTNFLESLRFDLEPFGIRVVVVSPGFVRTPLTDRNPFKMPCLIEPEEAADAMVRGIIRGAGEIHFPRRFSLFMKFLRIIPYPLYARIVGRMTRDSEGGAAGD